MAENDVDWEPAIYQAASCLRSARAAIKGMPLPPDSWRTEAALTFALVQLKDALHVLSSAGRRVTVAEDLPDGKDLTAHIADMRNVACHFGSPIARIGKKGSLRFCSAGPLQKFGIINGVEMTNPYFDDVAFFYGVNRLFLNRHMLKATTGAEAILANLAREHSVRL